MADSNLSVSISADSAKLRAELAVAQSSMRAFQTELSRSATAARKAGDDMSFAKVAQSAALFEKSSVQVEKLKTQLDGLSKSAGINRIGLMELQASGVNAFQALASGMDIFRVASTEGAQVLGGLIQGGLLPATGSLIGMAAAAAAVVVPIGYLAYQAYQTKLALNGMSTELLLTGRLGGTSFVDLNNQATELAKKFGISKAAAAELMQEIAKAGPTLSEQTGAINRVAVMAATLGAARRGGGEDIKDVDIAKQLAAAFTTAAGAIGLLEKNYNLAATGARQYARDGKEVSAISAAMSQLEEHIKNQASGWVEAKKTFDAYWTRVMIAEGSVDPAFVGPRPPTPTERPSAGAGTIEATDAEARLLAEIRRRENGGRYDTFHATGQQVTSLEDVERLPGKSHAFGAYGFQPGTYRDMAAITGRYDLSPASQDANAVQLLRKYGPNATQSWAASGPYDTAGITGAAAGDAAGAAQKAEDQRQADLQKEAIYQQQRAINNRHSLDEQLKDAEKHYDAVSKLEGAQSQKAKEADVAVHQKKAEIWDSDTNLHIASLNAQQAAAVDLSEKLRIQDEKTAYRRQRGSFDLGGGGVDKAALAQDAIERAAIVKQQGQQGFQLAEQGAGAQRGARADVLKGFEAAGDELAKMGQLTPFRAINAELAMAKTLADENAADLQNLMSAANSVADRTRVYWEQWREGVRASAEQQELMKKRADDMKAVGDRWAAPFKSAFDTIGSTLESSISGLLDRSKTLSQVWADLGKSATSALVDTAGSILSKTAAGFVPGSKPGEGFGEAAGNLASNWLGKQLSSALNIGDVAKDSALIANTVAITANTAALGVSAGASAAGGAGSALGAAGSAGGILGGLAKVGGWVATALGQPEIGVPLALAGSAVGGSPGGGTGGLYKYGGIVPSAAGGWVLPSSPGAQPAILHSREMVLPAPISEGIQSAIAGGGLGGGGMAFHLHALVADGPAVERMFKNNGRVLSGVMRDALRSNRLTPRTI